jgi:hypothetical protein
MDAAKKTCQRIQIFFVDFEFSLHALAVRHDHGYSKPVAFCCFVVLIHVHSFCFSW